MYTTEPLTGTHLPDKTLCLTYDDGPGEHTLPIARFLHEQSIQATFFVVGKYAFEHPEILAELQSLGHIVANHTFEHPDLPYYVSVNGNIQDQVVRTDALIKPYVKGKTFFRAPYGKWSADVANELNSNFSASFNHVGPVYWDVGGIDCYYWLQNKTVEEALESYLTTIRKVRKGIVVMHDEIADMDFVKPKNKTFELTQALVTALQKENYQFIGLDKVYANIEKAETVRLFSGSNAAINIDSTSGKIIVSNMQKATHFTLHHLGYGQCALQAENGKYLSVKMSTNEVLLEKNTMDSSCKFHWIPVFNNRVILRVENGHFLHVENETVKATAAYMRSATIFNVVTQGNIKSAATDLPTKYILLKKRFQFLRMKLMTKLRAKIK